MGSYTALPTEVEEVVITHPSVAIAAAVDVPDKFYGEAIWLCVVAEAGKTVNEEEVHALCNGQNGPGNL